MRLSNSLFSHFLLLQLILANISSHQNLFVTGSITRIWCGALVTCPWSIQQIFHLALWSNNGVVKLSLWWFRTLLFKQPRSQGLSSSRPLGTGRRGTWERGCCCFCGCLEWVDIPGNQELFGCQGTIERLNIKGFGFPMGYCVATFLEAF